MRELTSGLYFEPRHIDNQSALDSLTYTKKEIERIAMVAFELASQRKKKRQLIKKMC